MKKTIIFFLLLYTTLVFTQKEANIWYFGRNAGIDFNSGSPVALTNGKLNTFEGSSSIADKNGALLFYSDGATVWDKNHAIMPNGNGLLGNSSSSQSALIVPNPTISNIFYLFTVDAQENNLNGVNYSIIDMTLNNGNGDITVKNTPLINSATEKITAVIGKTCDSFWVITADTQNFYTYEVTSSGVNNIAIQSSIGTTLGALSSRGYLKISPDGTKLAMAAAESGTFLYDFNTNDGTVTNQRKLDLNFNDGYGVEFSISGNKLYIATGISSTGGQANLYQFDVSNPDINIINNSRGNPFFTYSGARGALQIASNGKIYHAIDRKEYLGVINSPESNKNDLNYIHNGVDLKGRKSSQGLPPFVQSYFLPTTILNAENNAIISNTKQFFCAGKDYYLKAGRIESGATYIWKKDNNIIGTDSILTTNNINFGPGIYNLTIELNNACNTTLTASTDIEFVPQPTLISIPIFEKCDKDTDPTDEKTTFDLTTKEADLTNNNQNVSVDFFSQSDINFTNPLPKNNYINQTNPETIIARVSFNSSNNSNCFTVGTLTLNVINSTLLQTNLNDVIICESDINANDSNAVNSLGSGNNFYDFEKKIDEIINLNPIISLNTHSIEFYRSLNDYNTQSNPIKAPYNDDLFINDSEIFVRITSKSSNSCPFLATFKIFIKPLPTPKGNNVPMLLCTNIFSNNTIDLNAFTGDISDTYQWYKNGEIIPNATDAIYKASSEGTYKVIANSQYSCTGFNTFTVITSSKATITNIKITDNTLNDNSISITVEGDGNYEYTLSNIINFIDGFDNFNYTFTNLPVGIYTIQIRDKNGCGITYSDEIPILFFQKHCTPNSDGFYDTWKILGVDNNFFQSVTVNIYDRYGKKVAVIPNKSHQGWNGIYNGKKLPSTDYWYDAMLLDKNGKIRRKKSHFSLLRK